jgi:hypothetical protein
VNWIAACGPILVICVRCRTSFIRATWGISAEISG